ncbi:MAG: DUF2291 domain-containing protein [Propionivibrio sp.]
MHNLRKKLVPALIASLCAILLPLAGCRIVPNDQRTQASGSSANQTTAGFDAVGYVNSVWTSQLIPHFDSKSSDLATVIAAVKADLDKAGHDYGHRAATEGSPWSFAVKSTGKVVSVNTESRAGTLVVEIASDAGPQQITLQIGPVVKGTAIRDSLPFFSFGNVTNQIEFAQVGRSFNERALKEIEKPLAELKTPGTAVAFTGAISLTDVPETFVITPVSLKAAGSAQ